MHDYGFILKQLRQLNGYSLKTAAAKIEKSVGWLSEVENNHGLSRLRPSEFERIVKLFNGDQHREMFRTWVATEKNKSKTDRTQDGAILKHIREKRGLTLPIAAKLIGISPGYLSHLENGSKPTNPDMKDQVMRAYGYTPSSFRNFSRAEKSSRAVPLRYRIAAILNQLKPEDLQPIYELAAKLMSAEEKSLLSFLQPDSSPQE